MKINYDILFVIVLSMVAQLIPFTNICFAEQRSNHVVLSSEVDWQKLNPARGDKSPQAATLWGDRKGEVPTGFLVKFVDGFSSPPHIHNVTYRGMVINGLIHNDDPSAEKMWMPRGSFWTQPKGEVHITAAKGDVNIAYIEIDSGPYLVLPTEEAYDSGERPVNVDTTNIVWVDLPIKNGSSKKAKIAYLWGSPNSDQLYGSLIRLPARFSGTLQSYGSIFRAVVIEGHLKYKDPNEVSPKDLDPGSYFGSGGDYEHPVSSDAEKETIIYIRTNGQYEI